MSLIHKLWMFRYVQVYMSTHVSHHVISHTQALLRGAARQILPVTKMSTCQSFLLTIRQYTSHMHFICTQDADEDVVEIWQWHWWSRRWLSVQGGVGGRTQYNTGGPPASPAVWVWCCLNSWVHSKGVQNQEKWIEEKAGLTGQVWSWHNASLY